MDAPGEAILAHKWGLFLELMRWAEGGSCRHDAILRTLASYFERQREFTANGKRQRAKTLNPSLLDFLARHNETAAVPVIRLEQPCSPRPPLSNWAN